MKDLIEIKTRDLMVQDHMLNHDDLHGIVIKINMDYNNERVYFEVSGGRFTSVFEESFYTKIKVCKQTYNKLRGINTTTIKVDTGKIQTYQDRFEEQISKCLADIANNQRESIWSSNFLTPPPASYFNNTTFLNTEPKLIINPIKKVIFSNIATIVFFSNGSKQVVKLQKGDTDDRELAILYAYFIGNYSVSKTKCLKALNDACKDLKTLWKGEKTMRIKAFIYEFLMKETNKTKVECVEYIRGFLR